MQFIVQYEDAVELPAGELVNMCKKLTFIRITQILDGSPVLLFDAILLDQFSIDDIDSVPSVELLDVLNSDGNQFLFTARMSGPIARLIISQDDAWPIAPIIIEKKQLVLSMQGTPTGLSVFRKQVKSLLGSRFKLTVNKSYQGEWLTAPSMSPRRKEVLETAIHMGYYNHPRECKQQDIAVQLNRKQGTIAEHLLLAEGNILKAWFEQSRISD
ncbi:MAG: helix-turn-helix domain-containing protein [Candidatus Poseidoniales archaeon]|nr:helix-turn-helix domain-containing protein [Candidatus Poseidoniales archaeon]